MQSGIPSGAELAMQWLEEIHRHEDFEGLPLSDWATPKNLGISGFSFKRAAEFYPYIYRRRFQDDKEVGYSVLERIMEKARPSYGYSVLAQIMATTRHNMAVTTNFDNLPGDSLAIYTRPLICGHESLCSFIRPPLRRPIIAKIHHDLLLNPRSAPDEIEKLPPEWEEALARIFPSSTPIVIGYGGNDGSLMGFLKKIPPIEGGIFWCFQKGHEPSDRIKAVVDYHRGTIVSILGFDELMVQLHEVLKLDSPILQLQKVQTSQIEHLNAQMTELKNRVAKAKEHENLMRQSREAARPWEIISKALSDASSIFLLHYETQQAANDEERERIYWKHAGDWADARWFWEVFAHFLWKKRGKLNEAKDCFQKAFDLDPDHLLNSTEYREFITAHPELKIKSPIGGV